MSSVLVSPAPSAAARLLGLAGLIPFVAGAAAVWLAGADLEHRAALVLNAYTATIMSFLGGIHWGLAARRAAPADALLWWGVTPSLVAWVALLLPDRAGLPLQAAALVACYLVDARVYPREGLAGWLPLRRLLTAVAVLSCVAGAVAVWR
jgi:hypothetical protein